MSSSRKFLKKRSVKAGLSPGTLVHIGEAPSQAVLVNTICYNQTLFEEQKFENLMHITTLKVYLILMLKGIVEQKNFKRKLVLRNC